MYVKVMLSEEEYECPTSAQHDLASPALPFIGLLPCPSFELTASAGNQFHATD